MKEQIVGNEHSERRILFLAALLILLLIQLTSAQPSGCPPAMSGYWRLDESSSGPYLDYYGGNSATCVNCPTAVGGRVGGAQQFDGANDQVIIPDNDTYDWGATADFAIEFWMNSAACQCTSPNFECNQVIVGRFGVSGAWWIGVNCQTPHDGKLRAYFGNNNQMYSTTTVTDNQWHHVAVVRDNTANEYRLYIDGTLEASYTESGVNRGGAADLQVGWANSAPFYRYHGMLDELALYSGLLTASEIATHHTSGLIGEGYCELNASPTIVSAPVTTARVGHPYSYDVNALGSPAPTYLLMVSPTGMTIDETTGVISWMPTNSGAYAVTVRATNVNGNDTQPYTINVSFDQQCEAGLTHYWTLDETTTGTYSDLAGLPATCSDCPLPATGIVGGAQEFNHTTNLVAVPDNGSFDWSSSNSFSIEFWMKKNSNCAGSTQPNNEVILGRAGAGWWIGVNCESPLPTEKIRAYFKGVQLFSTTVVSDDVWHHVVFVCDVAAATLTLYVDGDAEATIAAPVTGYEGSDPLSIGYFTGPDLGKYRYGGQLDEVAIYNIPLSQSTITTHYNGGSGGAYCFICGDADKTGLVTISDAVFLINYIFAGGPAPYPPLAGDADCSGIVTISDVVYLIGFIFGGGPAPCSACE